MNSRQVTTWLDSLGFRGIKLGLENITLLLSRLGDPHRRYPVIHVTGTNGKGSTCAMVAAILKAAGYRTGIYTSPHLTDVAERFAVDGAPVSGRSLATAATAVRSAADVDPPIPVTYFEATTAMAFLLFADAAVAAAVVEVGLGGRFDATNVVDPVVAVITSVGVDHTAELGGTLREVAFEKMGIVKPGRPLVCGVVDKKVAGPMAAEARRRKAPLFFIGDDFTATRTGSFSGGERFRYVDRTTKMPRLAIGMVGKAQVANAGAAIKTALLLAADRFDRIDETAIRAGLAMVSVPGRFERMGAGPTAILDGAHNRAAAAGLAATIKARFGKPVHLIFGAMADKEYHRMLASLSPIAASVTLFAPPGDRAATCDAMEQALGDYAGPIRRGMSAAAVAAMVAGAGAAEVFLVTGSFYTVAALRPALLATLR
jgi:dihydrofolate synthase/folylpolyglutamate synthase